MNTETQPHTLPAEPIYRVPRRGAFYVHNRGYYHPALCHVRRAVDVRPYLNDPATVALGDRHGD